MSTTTMISLRKLITMSIITLIIFSPAYAEELSDNKSACRDEDPGYACQYKDANGNYVPGVCTKSSDGSENVCVLKANSQNPE